MRSIRLVFLATLMALTAAPSASAWTALWDSVELSHSRERTRCGKVSAKKAAKAAVESALANTCSSQYSRSRCESVCEAGGASYSGYGLWAYPTMNETSRVKGSSCGFLKKDWSFRFSGTQKCGCLCRLPD